MNKKNLNALTYDVIGAAIEVHKAIGPGLLAEVYVKCLKRELTLRQVRFRSSVVVPVEFKGESLSTELFCDLLVESHLAVSVQSTSAIAPIHSAQMLTYMKLLGAPKGLVLNFNCTNIVSEGQKTLVNEFFRDLPEG